MHHIISVIALVVSLSSAPAVANNEVLNPSTAVTADPDQAIKCRKVEVTGSLVKKGRVCKTVAEWRAIFDNNNYLARKLVEDGTTRPAGN